MFSEDVDLLTTGPEFSAPPWKNAREKVFKAIKQRVEEQTGLRLPDLNRKQLEERTFFYARGSYHCRKA